MLPLTLMSRELPKSYEPSLIEERWAEFWVREGIFNETLSADTQDGRPRFTMLLPPPNVTGVCTWATCSTRLRWMY